MSTEHWWRDGGFRRLFRGVAPDVVALLVAQGELSCAATETFLAWSKGGAIEVATLSKLEEEADEARRALLTALRRALATPIDQEDAYILSERCDRVVNAVRDVALEAEGLEWAPDEHAALMAGHLHSGMGSIVDGFAKLRRQPDAVVAAANQARSEARAVPWCYRDAIADRFEAGHARRTAVEREMYRRYVEAAQFLEAVADRLWFVVLADV